MPKHAYPKKASSTGRKRSQVGRKRASARGGNRTGNPTSKSTRRRRSSY